jgi:hypothetical protein
VGITAVAPSRNNQHAPTREHRDVRRLAIATGIGTAGALHYIRAMSLRHDKKYDRAEMALIVALSLIGFAAAPASGVAGPAALLASALLKYWWTPEPWKMVERALKDFTNQEIFWPLAQKRKLTRINRPLSSDECYEFRMLFELILLSAHVPGM